MSWQRLRELIGEGHLDCDDCERHRHEVEDAVAAIVRDAVADARRRRRWWR